MLARLDRPIGVWLLVLPGFWAIALGAQGVWEGARLFVLFALGAIVTRAAGCVVNDLWDRELDRRVARTAARPLAAGTVTPLAAVGFLGVLGLLGIVVLVQLPWVAILVGLGAIIPVVLYPLAKRVTDWPQLALGAVFGWGALLGWAAATGGLAAPAAALYAAAILWILGYDTVYAHQDRADDARVGVRSSALRLGVRTRPFLAATYAGTVAALGLAGALVGLNGAFYVGLAVPAALLARQVVQLDIDNPTLCLRLFQANREVGIAITAAILLGRA